LKLAAAIAGSIKYAHSTFQERKSHAQYGLVLAAMKYNPGLNKSFGSFAISKMRGEVLEGTRGADSLFVKGRRKSQTSAIEDAIHEPSMVCYRWNPERIVLERERRREVHLAVTKLPASWRYVVSQRAFEGADCRSIGAALGVNQSRVSQLWGKALRGLREELPRG
jgi:RNA polymerase sigma factor (sigma-70 family)